MGLIDISRQVKIAAIQHRNKDYTLDQAMELINQYKGDMELLMAYLPKKGKKTYGRTKGSNNS